METIIGILVILFLGWFILRMVQKDDLGTIVGFGTKLYGKKDTAEGKIKTKWITLFYVPVFPLKSYLVYFEQVLRGSVTGSTTQYQLRELPKLYKPQVIPVMVVVWPLIILIALAALIQGLTPNASQPNASQPLSGVAPDFPLSFYPAYDGGLGKQQINLSELRGQVVLINFCASWSASCRDMLPVLERIWSQYRAKGVVILGIGFNDNEADALKYLKKSAVTYLNGPDLAGNISSLYNIHGAPESYLIDRQGKIIWFKVGLLDEKWLEAELDKALAP
jgi:thiol-disulfide isomerase/thioredoxin